MTTMTPRVVDISHHNEVTDFHAVAAAGLWGVIHKATQGSRYRDPDYARRRQQARDAGLNWGAYHFNDGSDVTAQVENFITYAAPDESTLMVLDFEDNPRSNMSIQQAVQFLRLMERHGYKCAIYSGNRVKEHISKLSPADRAYLTGHLLWLCQYGPRPVLPVGWNEYFLWQYTGDGVGLPPHSVSGIKGTGIDLNVFGGTRAELDAKWSSYTGDAPPLSSAHATAADADGAPSAHSSRAADDQDDAPALPPFLRQGSRNAGGLNVQPVRTGYSVECEVAQRELDTFGYHEVGDIDGVWGGKTAGAIKAFFNDRGVTAIAELGPVLNLEIARAKKEGFSRPIAPSRANAQPKDLAPKNEAVHVSLWQRFWAKIATGAAGLGLVGTGPGSIFQGVQDKLATAQSYLTNVPGWVWFALALGIAAAVWYASERAARAVTKDYNTGRLN